MQRYFSNQKEENTFILTESDTYHITKVMRMNLQDLIEVVYQEKTYLCEVVELLPVTKALKKQELLELSELSYQITIAQALVKEQKMDYIIQKTTELGVEKLIPFPASRSVIKLNQKETKKLSRWQTIAKEASEQSKRVKIPVITEVTTLSNLVKLSEYDMRFLCTLNESSQNIKKLLSNVPRSVRMLFVIGPEGGFTKEEETLLLENGFISLSLGKTVLRTETASTFIMSIIRYLDME